MVTRLTFGFSLVFRTDSNQLEFPRTIPAFRFRLLESAAPLRIQQPNRVPINFHNKQFISNMSLPPRAAPGTLLFAMQMKFCPIFALAAALLPAALFAQERALAPASPSATVRTQGQPFTLLHPADYRHYAIQFAADEQEATGKQSQDEWPWLETNVPLFSSSDKQFEQMYYFRWYAWQKHVVSTSRGFLITEWLPRPDAPDGFYGALPDAAPFHLGEARWLRFNRFQDIHQDNYLIGPKVPVYHFWKATVYGKALGGFSRMDLGYGHGNFTTIAFGGVLDVKLTKRISIRAFDGEYQYWPSWGNSKLTPYGASAGIGYRVF